MPNHNSKKDKRSFEELIEELAISIARGFAEARQDLRDAEQRLAERLDRIEFGTAGQERRISTLEDRMRQVATLLKLQ